MVVSEQYLKLEYIEATLSYHTIGFTTSMDLYLVAFVILSPRLLTDNHSKVYS